MVIRPFAREPHDQVIMHSFLDTNKLPSWLSTYVAVRKKWQLLVEANIQVLYGFDTDSPFLLTSNDKAHHRRRNWLTNYRRFISRAKSFFRKRVA
jgi:hypothetical protein